jgi:hypothetical protein
MRRASSPYRVDRRFVLSSKVGGREPPQRFDETRVGMMRDGDRAVARRRNGGTHPQISPMAARVRGPVGGSAHLRALRIGA